MSYSYPSQNYSINLTAIDSGGLSGTNGSTFLYNELAAGGFTAGYPITFGTLAAGTSNNSATSNPLNTTNQGNVALNLSWSGTNLTNTTTWHNISVDNVLIANQSTLPGSSYIVLSTSPQTFRTDLAVLGTYDNYLFLTVPSGTSPEYYSGTLTVTFSKA